MTAEPTWLERYVEERMREYEERIRLRELKRAAREAGHRCAAAKRVRESEERVRFRKLRTQPCGAKTRAGHPCQREGLGRGGRCPNHGGASTRPRKNELKRYALGTKNKSLKYNDDGSLTIYLGNKSPGKEKESNWLPAPAGNFSIWTRAYWPDKAILDGTWKPPVIEVVITSGRRCRLLRVVLQMRLTIAFDSAQRQAGTF